MWWQMCSKNYVVHCELLDIVALQDFFGCAPQIFLAWNFLETWLTSCWVCYIFKFKIYSVKICNEQWSKAYEIIEHSEKPYKCLYFSISKVKCQKNLTTSISTSLLQDPRVRFLFKYFVKNFDDCSVRGSF